MNRTLRAPCAISTIIAAPIHITEANLSPGPPPRRAHAPNTIIAVNELTIPTASVLEATWRTADNSLTIGAK